MFEGLKIWRPKVSLTLPSRYNRQQLWGWPRGWNSKEKLCVHDVFVRSGKFVQGAGLFWFKSKKINHNMYPQNDSKTILCTSTFVLPITEVPSKLHWAEMILAWVTISTADEKHPLVAVQLPPDEQTMWRAVTSVALASALRQPTLKGFSESPANATD